MPNDMTFGLPRSYFNRRLSVAIREVIARGPVQEERREEMVFKVNIEENVQRLKVCPVCGCDLFVENTTTLTCDCGVFVMTDMWTDGAIVFSFTLHPADESEQPVEVEVTDEHSRVESGS